MRSIKRQRGFIGLGGILSTVGSVAGPLIGGAFGQQAASQQVGSANRAQDIMSGQFQQTQQNLAPFMQAGTQSLSQLSQGLQPGGQFSHMFGLQDFQASPAYQFNLQEGQKAIDKAANARGNLYAPQTLQDISKFSQGLASNEFQNAFQNYQTGTGNIWNRLFGLTNLGQTSAAGVGNIGAQTAQGIGNAAMAGGNAQAAGTMAIGNALGGGINNLTNLALMNQMLVQQQQGMGGANPFSGMLDTPVIPGEPSGWNMGP